MSRFALSQMNTFYLQMYEKFLIKTLSATNYYRNSMTYNIKSHHKFLYLRYYLVTLLRENPSFFHLKIGCKNLEYGEDWL